MYNFLYMAGETAEKESGWTVDTLKVFMESKISYEAKLSAERDKRYSERWKAQEAASKNLKEYQNEFRGALDDLSTKQATKVELGATSKTLTDKIEANNSEISLLRSRLDVGNPAIGLLQQGAASANAVKQSSAENWGKIFAIIAATGVIVGIIFRFIPQ